MYRIGIVTGQYGIDATSHDLFEAAREVGEAVVVDPIQFSVELNGNHAIKIAGRISSEFDALVIRGLDFGGEVDFQFEVFEQLDRSGVLVVNSPAALQIAESKFLTSFILQEKGFAVPSSVIVQKLEDGEAFLSEHEDIIAKPLYGFQGHGVIRIKVSERDARERIERLLCEFKAVCLQRFIPNPGRDIRVFVVGAEVVASIYRLAQKGRWKTNIRAGARAIPCELTEEQRSTALRVTQALGLDYTGVDIIEGPEGDYVLEVNGAPAWGGILEATGRNVARDIIGHIIKRLNYKTG